MNRNSLHERITETSDRLAEKLSLILEYAKRGERPPKHIEEERKRIAAELAALDEERRLVTALR